MDWDVPSLVEQKESGYGVVGYLNSSQNTHCEAEEGGEERAIPLSIALGYDNVDCGTGMAKRMEVDASSVPMRAGSLAGRDRPDMWGCEALALSDYTCEYRALEVALRLCEGAPVDRHLRIGRRVHLFCEWRFRLALRRVNRAKGDEFVDHGRSGIPGDMREVEKDRTQRGYFRVAPECFGVRGST